MKKLALHWQILLGMLAGVIFALIMTNFSWGAEFVSDWIKPFGNIFINALKLIAVPLILEKEVPCWTWSQVAETWESMRSYFLGAPHGARSSLFVSQETGQGIKKVWETLIYTGMFGPIKV